MNVNWYPGHMRKTKMLLLDKLKAVDIIFEIIDARIPISSKNDDLNILGNKPKIIILNKCDLSNAEGNKKWIEYYNRKNLKVISVTANKKININSVLALVNTIINEKNTKASVNRIKSKSLHAMVVGIPNVGKSTFINAICNRKGAKTGKQAGITKCEQWLNLKGKIKLLDTPGILWPKIEDPDVVFFLCATGAIKDDVFDREIIALELVKKISKIAPEYLTRRYKIINISSKTPLDILDDIANSRGCITKNRGIDYVRVSNLILNDYRKGLLGQITFEYPV